MSSPTPKPGTAIVLMFDDDGCECENRIRSFHCGNQTPTKLESNWQGWPAGEARQTCVKIEVTHPTRDPGVCKGEWFWNVCFDRTKAKCKTVVKCKIYWVKNCSATQGGQTVYSTYQLKWDSMDGGETPLEVDSANKTNSHQVTIKSDCNTATDGTTCAEDSWKVYGKDASPLLLITNDQVRECVACVDG